MNLILLIGGIVLNKEEKYDKFVEEHIISEYTDLLDIIRFNDSVDLRENFIFRGLKKLEYDLTPSSLRKDDDGEFNINKYISNLEFNFYLTKKKIIGIDGERAVVTAVERLDKQNNQIYANPQYSIRSEEELHFKREIYVLLKFLDYADKIGLKIPASSSVRRWIHNHLSYENKINDIWPKPEFYEIISLAQHHGLPTRALDWSYDYKVALYFAVEDILKGNEEDCVLWAFNYKLFEQNYHEVADEVDKFIIYRPEYNVNSNLKAQKGLFTFLTTLDYKNIDDDISFDEFILENLQEIELYDRWSFVKKLHYEIDGFESFQLKENEKIFHKFVISGNLKAKILNDLYLDGYAYENIFPGYGGVVQSIENRVILEDILNTFNKQINIH